MARKSARLNEIISLLEIEEKTEDIERLEPDVIFIQRINDNASLIVDERVNGYVLHSVESVLLLVIFGIIANCNTFTNIYVFDCERLNG